MRFLLKISPTLTPNTDPQQLKHRGVEDIMTSLSSSSTTDGDPLGLGSQVPSSVHPTTRRSGR